jgi:hypothetical protein
MRSILFLIASSFCATCSVFASELIEIETQQPANVIEVEEKEAMSCNKCKRPSCPGCGTLSCSKCTSLILACKDGKKPGCTCPKEFIEEELACKDGKKPGCTCPKEFTEEELACKDGKKPGCTCPKEFSEEKLIASKKNRRTAVLACGCGKRKKSKSLLDIFVCDEETVETEEEIA